LIGLYIVYKANNWQQTVNGSGSTTWAAKDILTQSAAQQALAGLDSAINAKDEARANLGATQNRLENTITNLQIQAENLQAAGIAHLGCGCGL
jgi:flagellin